MKQLLQNNLFMTLLFFSIFGDSERNHRISAVGTQIVKF